MTLSTHLSLSQPHPNMLLLPQNEGKPSCSQVCDPQACTQHLCPDIIVSEDEKEPQLIHKPVNLPPDN